VSEGRIWLCRGWEADEGRWLRVDGRLRCIEAGPQQRDAAAVTQTPDECAADVWALPQHRHRRLPASSPPQHYGDVHRVAAEALIAGSAPAICCGQALVPTEINVES
jgi:hypothetical protein